MSVGCSAGLGTLGRLSIVVTTLTAISPEAQAAQHKLGDVSVPARDAQLEWSFPLSSAPAGLAVDDAGSLYTYLPAEFKLVALDGRGELRWQQHTSALGGPQYGILDGRIWMVGPRNETVTYWNTAGAILHRETIRVLWRDSVGTAAVLAGPLANGSYLGTPTSFNAVVAAGVVNSVPFLSFSADGAVDDTIAWLPVASHHTMQIPVSSNGTAIGYMTPPIGDAPIFRTAPYRDYVVVVTRPAPHEAGRHTFDVIRVALTGDTLNFATIPYDDHPITDDYVDTLISERFASNPPFGGRVSAEAFREAMWVPMIHPPVRDVVVGIDSTTWLAASSPQLNSPTTWTVLGTAMVPVFRVALPRSATVQQINGASLWTTEQIGEVWYIRRYHLVRRNSDQ